MVVVILISRHYKINPDNVATPIAASLGDLTTLALLSWIASFLYDSIGKFQKNKETNVVWFNLLSNWLDMV